MEPSVWSRYWQALLCEGHAGHAEALRVVSEVLASEPTHHSARVHRGKALVLLGRPEEAAGEFRRVLEQDAAHWEARVNLAALYILLGLYPEAEAELLQARAHSPASLPGRPPDTLSPDL